MPNDSETGKPKNGKQKKLKIKSKKFVLILLALLLVLAGSAGAFLYYNNPAVRGFFARESKHAELENLDMGEMVVNLAANGGMHYLRLNVIIEYPREKKLAEEIKKKRYQLADVIIANLRNKTFSEVSSTDSIERLKKSLLNEINSHLEKGQAVGLYFTDFLIQ